MDYVPYLKRLVLAWVLATFFLTTFVFNLSITSGQQYWHLADAFLHGKLYFLEDVGTWEDAVFYKGHDYWHEGPFPAIILMPAVLFKNFAGIIVSQGAIHFIITLFVFFLCFKLSRKYRYSKIDALLLAFAFCFASVYQLIAFIPWSWYFLQNVTVLLLFLSLWEYFGKRRYWIIGTLFACIFASRFSAGLGIGFFIAAILISGLPFKQKATQLIHLLMPVVVCGILLLSYNVLRFGDMFDNGFLRSNDHTLTEDQRYEQMHYGLFQLRNIPTNIYYYFIKSVDPVTEEYKSLWGNTYILTPPYIRVAFPGTSFFVVAPIFLYCLKVSWKKRLNKLLLIPILCILSLLMLYYWPGWRQVGPRYLLDLLPFAYLLLLSSFKNAQLSRLAIFIIVISALIDFYLFYTVMSAAISVANS